ncbi:hypothetical protein HanXRQr2_Chr17g0811431 [Helianthus annuus]|uniref:Uncharacterized protein n=1 Tax=Helianthus annuus TaxID=4232 RepID=A0A251RSD0_HELAN|nr:uncharacterized protein LOC110922125 isoform X1 [Helianthus annuus]KAF5756165.1 hypothetical protein HanXRQr2_Chr17g0811431 [Helianthus annuus]
MGDKRLNFNRPLLSVRRTVANSQKGSTRKNETSTPALLPSPSYRSDLHSGPLRNPGTVPFVWEQIPGRPKDEGKTQKPPLVPSPPPGRILKERSQDMKKRSGNDINEKPQLTYGPNFLQLNDDDTEDDSEFEYDEPGHMSLQFCGLLPHFCLKTSIGMLNQTPVRTRLPVSSANRTRVGASSQDARVAAYEPKSSVKNQKDPTILNHESTENTKQKNSQKLEQGDKISYNHNASSPPPFVSEENEVNIQKKGLVSFKELLAQELQAHENEKETNFENPTIEKTLYVDTVHKVESSKSEFKETDGDIFGISLNPTEPFMFDLVFDNTKHDKEMIQTGACNDPKVDKKVKASQKSGLEMPAPPPLPKSPSDSWLWRTLPSVNSKTAPLWSNHKQSSKTTTKQGKNVQSRYPQGLLLPISET